MNTNLLLIICGICILIFVIIYFVNLNNNDDEVDRKINHVDIGYIRNPSNFMMNTSLQTIYYRHAIIPITNGMNAKKLFLCQVLMI